MVFIFIFTTDIYIYIRIIYVCMYTLDVYTFLPYQVVVPINNFCQQIRVSKELESEGLLTFDTSQPPLHAWVPGKDE